MPLMINIIRTMRCHNRSIYIFCDNTHWLIDSRLVLKFALAHLNANARDESNANIQDLNQMQMNLDQMQLHLNQMLFHTG